MALSLRDVRCDPIANRALNELMHHYTVAQEKSRLVLTKKTGGMKLFLNDLDDLYQWDFIRNQQMVKQIERLRVLLTTTNQHRESWKVRALMAEAQLLEATVKTGNKGVVRMSVTSGMRRSSAIWQSGSTPITPPDRASRSLFETRSSKKSGTRLIASIKESRPPAARRRDQLRRPDRAICRSARPCNDAHAAWAEILLEHRAFSRQVVPFRLTQSRISVPSPPSGDRASKLHFSTPVVRPIFPELRGAGSGRLRRRAFSVHWLCCSGVTRSSCPTGHGVRQSQDAMSQHGAHMREVERPLALAVGELDLALRQVCARLHGQARKPGRGRVEDPSHQVVPSIKERIVNRFPIFLGGTDRAVELHQLVLELEEGGIVAGRIMFRHRVSSLGARTSFSCKAARKRARIC